MIVGATGADAACVTVTVCLIPPPVVTEIVPVLSEVVGFFKALNMTPPLFVPVICVAGVPGDDSRYNHDSLLLIAVHDVFDVTLTEFLTSVAAILNVVGMTVSVSDDDIFS